VAGYASLEDLDGHSVAVVSGSTSDVLLSDTNNFANIRLIRYSTPTELIEAVMNDSADCGITDTVVLMTLEMEQHGLAVDFNLPGGFDVAVAFNPKDKELCGKFNDFLVQVKSDGTLDEMFARWCSEQVDTVHMLDMPELAELKGHPIEVATLADNPPFSFYRNNRWTGLEVELMHRFSLFVGRPVHFSGYRFDEIVGVLLSRKADAAAANLFITPDRADKVLFSHPYYLCKTSCFSKAR
jgi:polar amino acid transport system substrate-binding protein